MISVMLYGANGKPINGNGEGEITVTEHTHPPVNEAVESYPFAQYFTDTGSSTGDNDMIVDGSTTPREFYIEGKPGAHTFIKSISVKLAGASATLQKFGTLSALTNGVDFSYFNTSLGEILIESGIKTNLDFMRLDHRAPPSSGSDAYKADLSGAGADAYLPVIDMSITFGYRWGIHLRKGTVDRIQFRINDDLTAWALGGEFNVKGFGIQV